MKKSLRSIIALGLCSLVSLSAVAGCSPQNSGNDSSGTKAAVSGSTGVAGNEGEVIVQFWTAPQVVQYNYWSKKAEEFNASQTKVNGKVIKVEVQQMPESPSSEAGIQNSVATGTTPALSENINRGFAKTLAASEVIYNLSEEPWFEEVIKSRAMEESIKAWEIDGSQYVLPIYSNPMIYQWNVPALKAMGLKEPPKTLEEFKAFVTAFREAKDTKLSEIGVTATFYRPSLIRPDQWWDRWFDFQMQYGAFSGGKGWVENDELILDEAITQEVFELYGLLGDTLQTAELSTLWSSDQVPFVFSLNAPWEIQMLREAGKVYGLEGDYVYGQPIVKAEKDTPYCFGDSKGLVLYKTENITDEMHQGAIEFVKWIYNPDNTVTTDLDWLKATNMLPARGDLTTNQEFQTYLKDNVELNALAPYVPYAIPSMASEKMTDIQTAFTEFGFAPYFEKVMTITEVAAPDAKEDVQNAFAAMKDVME